MKWCINPGLIKVHNPAVLCTQLISVRKPGLDYGSRGPGLAECRRINPPFLSFVWTQGQLQQRSWCLYWGTKPVASAWILGGFAPLAAWCLSSRETPPCPASTSSLLHQTPRGTLFCLYLTALSTFRVPWRLNHQKTREHTHVLEDRESFNFTWENVHIHVRLCVEARVIYFSHCYIILDYSSEQLETSKSTTMWDIFLLSHVQQRSCNLSDMWNT